MFYLQEKNVQYFEFSTGSYLPDTVGGQYVLDNFLNLSVVISHWQLIICVSLVLIENLSKKIFLHETFLMRINVVLGTKKNQNLSNVSIGNILLKDALSYSPTCYLKFFLSSTKHIILHKQNSISHFHLNVTT